MKSKFIAVLSPAKLMDEQMRYSKLPLSQPTFLNEAESLMKKLKKLSAKEISQLMATSLKLGEENKERFNNWTLPFTKDNACPSILLFKGEVYRGLDAQSFTASQLKWSNNHIRILSGLYGVLKPLDMIQPYRLMMGTPWSPDSKHKNLYSFWGDKLGKELSEDLHKDGVIVNLASHEYFKALNLSALNCRVVSCEFKERKAGKVSVVATYAKLARGKMANFIISNEISEVAQLKDFQTDGYLFEPSLSTENEYVFVR